MTPPSAHRERQASGSGAVRVLPCGPAAVLAEVADAAAVAGLHDWLVAAPPPGLRAVVPAARTVLVEAEPDHLAAIRDHLLRFAVGPADRQAAPGPTDVVEVPVTYDGDDLEAVADRLGLSVAEVVHRHSRPLYTAAFCGFAPGFAYLIGGDASLELPRRDEPRTRVTAGSVAIAGEYSAVYPGPSPGGWHLLGRTSAEVWRTDRDPPALIPPGARVRFVPLETLR